MEYFWDERHVEDYVRMVEGLDGRDLIEILRGHLAEGSKVLELGMGPGNDLDILAETYSVTGSDYSEAFIKRYRDRNPEVDLLVMDARTLETDRTFDCIYSNKVLIHLSRDEMVVSLGEQLRLLGEDGMVLHSFWRGDKVEVMEGLRFVYYSREQLMDAFSPGYDVIEMEVYSEMDEDDSIYLVARKKE